MTSPRNAASGVFFISIATFVNVSCGASAVASQGLVRREGISGQPAGRRGRMGRNGPDGERGENGTRGDPGPVGEPGEQGMRGPPGFRGSKGDQGLVGPRGRDGPRYSAIDCLWSGWEEWEDCLVTCGVGFQRRERSIIIYPRNGGLNCIGVAVNYKDCNIGLCAPVLMLEQMNKYYTPEQIDSAVKGEVPPDPEKVVKNGTPYLFSAGSVFVMAIVAGPFGLDC